MSTRWLPFVLASLALAAPAAEARMSDGVVRVSVARAGPDFTVTIVASTNLRVVLQALCDSAEASCKLPASLPETSVRPRVIRGSWPEVVAELLQGSDLSFGATPPISDRAPYLFVELRAKAAGSAVAGPGSPAPGVDPSAAAQAFAEAMAGGVEEAPAEDEGAAAETADDANASVAPADPDATLVTAATAAATPGGNFATTPFTDGKGNPLMARVPAPGSPSAMPGMAMLPYPDEAGNPMVVPITNEPLSLTPFVGPDGQAWPAPVAQPGQKLEYPIPPTVPPPAKPNEQ